jgi:hypothetical protein
LRRPSLPRQHGGTRISIRVPPSGVLGCRSALAERFQRRELLSDVVPDHRSKQRKHRFESSLRSEVEFARDFRTVRGRSQHVCDRDIGLPLSFEQSSEGRSYVWIVTSYGVPLLTIPKREPCAIGSSLRSSALLTPEFHCVSLRRSASVSKTFSGPQAIRVVAVARTSGMLRDRSNLRNPLVDSTRFGCRTGHVLDASVTAGVGSSRGRAGNRHSRAVIWHLAQPATPIQRSRSCRSSGVLSS